MPAALLILALLGLSQAPVATVDLTAPPPDPGPQDVIVPQPTVLSGSFTPRDQWTEQRKAGFPVTLHLLRVVPNPGAGPYHDAALEVLLANTGAKPFALPVGLDRPEPGIAPASGNRHVTFTVSIATALGSEIIGGAQASGSSEDPVTLKLVQPGESVLYRLPLDTTVAAGWLASQQIPQATLSVKAGLGVTWSTSDGEYQITLGKPASSANSLDWSPPADQRRFPSPLAPLAPYILALDPPPMAYIDLTSPHEPREPAASYSPSVHCAVSYMNPDTPLPLDVRLVRYPDTDYPDIYSRDVEVALTNAGDVPLSIPAGGDDESILLAPGARRRSLAIYLTVNGAEPPMFGSARSDANNEFPDTALLLPPRQTVIFRVRLDTRFAPQAPTNRLGAVVFLERVTSIQDSYCSGRVSPVVKSRNTL